jgi:hypothetical protein
LTNSIKTIWFVLLGDFNAKVCREDIFKPIIGNENLYEMSNDTRVFLHNDKNGHIQDTTRRRLCFVNND